MNFFVFFLTFGILFIGELGDKTQLIVFNLSLEYKKSYKIGVGATLGFLLIVSLGIIFGAVLTTFIPINWITLISAIIFIVIGGIELLNLRKLLIESRKNELIADFNSKEDNTKSRRLTRIRKNPYLAGFGFIFLMELGDKTQILTITLASIYPYPFEVGLGSFLALSSLAWMGVFIGALIAKKVPKVYLKVISSIIFLTVGIITLFSLV